MAQTLFTCNLHIARCPLSELNRRHCTIRQSFFYNSDRGNHVRKTLRFSQSAAKDNVTDKLSAKREFPPEMLNDDVVDSMLITSYQCAGKEKRVQTLISEIKKMFKSMGDGETSPSAYDTAWVARVPALHASHCPQFPQTLQWILQNQLSDGSWGEKSCFLAYDRILSTIACVITLTLWSSGETQIKKGVEFVKNYAERMEEEADNHRLCGFEILFISMLKEAKSLGLDLPYDLPFIKKINQKRETKLEKIPLNIIHAVPTAILYSLEGLQEIIGWDKIMKLQSKDGSFLNSPASTAAAFIRTGDKKCLEFLTFVVNKFDDHVPFLYPLDLFERLWAVDTVERLGIDRHFKEEIKETLDYVYRHWDDRGIGWARHSGVLDIDNTAMGLRILRLHGYNVSSDALKGFRDKNGEFFCFMGETQRGVSDMLNVHRCSHVAFPGEKIMEEARLCTHRYLTNALQNGGVFDKWALKKDLQGEVEYILKYPWHRSMPRVEARSYIEQYGENDVWLGKSMYLMPNINNGKYLELAKLDFNKVQYMHQNEIPNIQSWLEFSGFTKYFTAERVVETYFIISASMFEPEFATCRAVYTKTEILTVILSDLFEAQCSAGDILLFSEAVQRWDLSLVNSMAEEMKICFTALYDTVNQIAEQGRRRQGRDVLPYLRYLWEVLLASYSQETEWTQLKYVHSKEKYMENAKESMGVATVVLTSILFTGELHSEEVLLKFCHGSKFLYLVALTGSLVKDTKTYQEKRKRGKPSAIEKYMRNHPEISEKEAVDHIYLVMQSALLELNWELVNNREMPERCRKLIFNTARYMQLFYMERDGFTQSHLEMKEVVKRCLFQPVGV